MTEEKVKVSFYNKNNPQPETQPDYNQNDETVNDYIKNRPGGYYVDVPEVDITWDGIVDSKEVISVYDTVFVKVSNESASIEQLIDSTLSVSSAGQTMSKIITNEYIEEYDGFYDIGCIIVATKDFALLNGIPITRGIYFAKIQNNSREIYTSRLYCPAKKVVKKIPASFVDLKGGYDTETINIELYNGNFSADDFIDTGVEQ